MASFIISCSLTISSLLPEASSRPVTWVRSAYRSKLRKLSIGAMSTSCCATGASSQAMTAAPLDLLRWMPYASSTWSGSCYLSPSALHVERLVQTSWAAENTGGSTQEAIACAHHDGSLMGTGHCTIACTRLVSPSSCAPCFVDTHDSFSTA